MYHYNDGGRSEAGYKGTAGDCGARALAIAVGINYKEAYNAIAKANKAVGLPKSARNGVLKEIYDIVLQSYGFQWVSAPKFIGRKAYCDDLTYESQPIIARQSGHYVCVIGGIPQDIFDSSCKMVYGYWKRI